jgi:DNA-binding FadR family transcriptional regulator
VAANVLTTGIHPVQQVAAYELVVDQVKRAIFLGRFLPGDKLPPERELARQLAVSRTTVREAIRMLEGERLVTTRRGAAGGATIEPFQNLENQTLDRIRRDVTAFEDLLDFRVAIEVAAARLAAQRRRKQDLQRMTGELDAMRALVSKPPDEQQTEDVASFIALDSAFHMSIARASRNDYLLRAVEDSRAQLFYPVGRIFDRLADNAHRSHDELFEAIAAQDPEAAEQAARDHIETTRAGLRQMVEGIPRRTRSQPSRRAKPGAT